MGLEVGEVVGGPLQHFGLVLQVFPAKKRVGKRASGLCLKAEEPEMRQWKGNLKID